jgi:hypothetical protein
MALSKIDPAGLDIGQIGGRRNLIINGAMQVAQRGTSATGVTSSGYYACDRFKYLLNHGTYTVTQEADGPDEHPLSQKIQCTSTGTPASAQYVILYHNLEVQDTRHLAFGTSSAKTTTISFWVKSNITGNHNVNLWYIRDVANNRWVEGVYTINSADTWEKKTITFSGDTSYAPDRDGNTQGFTLEWWLGGGSNYTGGTANSNWHDQNNTQRNSSNVQIGSSTDNYFQITGVQWEVGSVATPFEHRSYGEELALCQRYYQAYEGSGARGFAFDGLYASGSGNGLSMSWAFPVQMRSAPSHTKLYNDTQNVSSVNVATTIYGVQLETITSGSGRTAYKANGSGYIRFDAEL